MLFRSHNEADATRATQDYLDLLDRIASSDVRANASLKLTQLGLDVGEEICINNMRRILQRAKETNNFIRIDMEGSDYTERTLRIFRTLREEYGFKNVGISFSIHCNYIWLDDGGTRASTMAHLWSATDNPWNIGSRKWGKRCILIARIYGALFCYGRAVSLLSIT